MKIISMLSARTRNRIIWGRWQSLARTGTGTGCEQPETEPGLVAEMELGRGLVERRDAFNQNQDQDYFCTVAQFFRRTSYSLAIHAVSFLLSSYIS